MFFIRRYHLYVHLRIRVVIIRKSFEYIAKPPYDIVYLTRQNKLIYQPAQHPRLRKPPSNYQFLNAILKLHAIIVFNSLLQNHAM